MKLIKGRDLIIIVVLLLLGAVAIFLQSQNVGRTAIIRINGEAVKTVSLLDNGVFTIPALENVVFEVSDGKIRICENDCSSHLCVRTGYINGGAIICAPKGISVEIPQDRDVDAVIG